MARLTINIDAMKFWNMAQVNFKIRTAFLMISNVPKLICLAIARAHSVVMYVVCVFVVVAVCLIVITPLAKWTKRALDMVERTHILPNHRVHLIEQN